MKRWIAFAAALYPRKWRDEYGEEFVALLDDLEPRWRVFVNVLGGAIRMQITTGTNWLKLAAATAGFGAIVAAGASFAVAPQYVSSAVISVTPQPDPVRPASQQEIRKRAAERVAGMEAEILSRTSLSQIVQDPSLDLYKKERSRIPLEAVLRQMRDNIRIHARPSSNGGLAPIVFDISFSYPDQVKAQATVRVLAAKFTDFNVVSNATRETVYRNLWHDEAALAAALHHTKVTVPPPPVGDTATVLDPASLPMPVGPNRMVFLAWGLGAGLLLGLLTALAMRRPRGLWQLGAFAVAGCVLTAAVSFFLIPARYTSTAVMEISPAIVTEDPLATPPRVTPAADFLREWEPRILSFRSLSAIIQDPRINLYPGERARKPMEDVVRNMLAHDLRIAELTPASGAIAAPNAFTISFSYPDRTKARDVVQALITAFVDQRLMKQAADASHASDTRRDIWQRKADENLEVLDVPSLPTTSGHSTRLTIAAAGLGIGLLVGAIVLCFRKPRATLLPA